ncbi:MAG TPA: hypothetical protein VJS19_04565 [Candidatus Dormibacteraeota bacterium]|nr:hypothetical protein [Candidatus Dormibacteraeota bacterium]
MIGGPLSAHIGVVVLALAVALISLAVEIMLRPDLGTGAGEIDV